MTSDDMKATVEAAAFARLILEYGSDVSPVVAARCLERAKHAAEVWYAAKQAAYDREDAFRDTTPDPHYGNGSVRKFQNPPSSAYQPFDLMTDVILELRIRDELRPTQQPQPPKKYLKFCEVHHLYAASFGDYCSISGWNSLRTWLNSKSWVVRLAKDCDDK